jgi:hypothetical protein
MFCKLQGWEPRAPGSAAGYEPRRCGRDQVAASKTYAGGGPACADGRPLKKTCGTNGRADRAWNLGHADLVTTGRDVKNVPVPSGTTAPEKLDAYWRPLRPGSRNALRAWLREHDADESAPLFPARHGGPITRDGLEGLTPAAAATRRRHDAGSATALSTAAGSTCCPTSISSRRLSEARQVASQECCK